MISHGIFWDFLGKLFTQVVTFVVSVFLARLLFPEDFALIAMVMAFYSIATIFIDFGLSEALVQRESISEIQISSIFWINLFFATVLCVLFFFSSNLISKYYEIPELVGIAKAMSFVFILGALGSIHTAQMHRSMSFKKLSKINVISSTVSGIVGIAMAYSGYGVWSLIGQYYSASVMKQVMLWNATRWLPSFVFSWNETKPLFTFGKNLFFSQLLNTTFNQLDVFVIGKLFVPATLGFYSRAKNLDRLITSYSSGSLSTVLFPALSKIQSDKELVKRKVEDFYHLAAFISFFLGGLLYLTAEDVILFLYTEKWIDTIPYFKIMVLSTFAYPLSAIILTPVNSLGRSDLFLKLEIIKKVIYGLVYIVGFKFGIFGFLYGMLVGNVLAVVLNGFVSGKLIQWPVFSQIGVVLKYGIPVYIITFMLSILTSSLSNNIYLHGIICLISFITLNLVYATLLKLKGFELLKDFILSKVKNLKKRPI
jgi:O-antigen/teichoic acid export membrane protein